MFRLEYDPLVAINGTIILMLHLSLQSHGHLNHIRITEKISSQMLDTQLRVCDLAKRYSIYPVDPVVATSDSMLLGLCYISWPSASQILGVVKWL